VLVLCAAVGAIVAPQTDPEERFGEAILSQHVSIIFNAGPIYVTDGRRLYGQGSELFSTLYFGRRPIDAN
jgi:hypothetical protein